MLGIGRRTRPGVQNADFQNVARLGSADEDGSGADVNPQSFAGAPTKDDVSKALGAFIIGAAVTGYATYQAKPNAPAA